MLTFAPTLTSYGRTLSRTLALTTGWWGSGRGSRGVTEGCRDRLHHPGASLATPRTFADSHKGEWVGDGDE